MGAASPMEAYSATTVSRQASAMMAPPEYACVLTQATVLGMGEFLMASQISRTAPTSPPGVLSSKTMASALSRCAAAMRRLME